MLPLLALHRPDTGGSHRRVRVIPASFAERVNALLAEQPRWKEWELERDRVFASGDGMTLREHAEWITNEYPQELVDSVLRRVRLEERVNALLAEQPRWKEWELERDRVFASGADMTERAKWIEDNYPQQLVDSVLLLVRVAVGIPFTPFTPVTQD